MPYRMLETNKNYKQFLKKHFLKLKVDEIITLGKSYEIIENNYGGNLFYECQFIKKLSKNIGEQTLLVFTTICSVDTCPISCTLRQKEIKIFRGMGSCTCSSFFIKKVLCIHIMYLKQLLVNQQQRKLEDDRKLHSSNLNIDREKTLKINSFKLTPNESSEKILPIVELDEPINKSFICTAQSSI